MVYERLMKKRNEMKIVSQEKVKEASVLIQFGKIAFHLVVITCKLSRNW